MKVGRVLVGAGVGLLGLLAAGAAFAGGLPMPGLPSPSLPRARRLAQITKIPVRIIGAIAAVESGGRDSAVRFEPHTFLEGTSTLATGTKDAKRRASPHWGKIPYTPKSATEPWSVTRSETDRAAYARAAALNPTVAVRATSWGTYQVLGAHLLPEGTTPALAVAAFDADPAAVSDRLFARWMAANPAAKAAALARNWREFARLYNGPGQVEKYGGQLAQVYDAHPELDRETV